jgi:predicted RNase H-like HicB family nuclease
MELFYTYWESGEWLLGYLNDYPEHWTQGKDLAELEEMLKDLYELLVKEEPLSEPHKQGTLLVTA